ncbi:hypothetical protein [Photobacterium damselae]|uniref:hypothetical protein n=1 Tax=Photobacterium damselae TaxID=38293 RepID=UPI0040694FE9
MSFSLYLKNKLSKTTMSRTNIIAQLNLFHSEFKNLDAITFSRWINNKTTPSPYKQILISDYFNDDPIIFIQKHISIKKESKTISNIFDNTMKALELSYTNISYFHNNEKAIYNTVLLNQEKYDSMFKAYYDNFETYKKLSILTKKLITSHICITKKKGDIISSHISFFKINDKLSDVLSDFFMVKITNDYFINLSYIEDRESYLFMKSLLLYFLYHCKAKNFICLIRSDFLDFLTSLPYEQVGGPYKDGKYKLYLVKVDFLNLVSTPFVINFFRSILEQHNNNLYQFFSEELLEIKKTILFS